MADTESAPGVSAAQVTAMIAAAGGSVTVVANQAAMLALPDNIGQRAIRTDLGGEAYMQLASPATVLANWQLSTADVASEVAFVPTAKIAGTNVQTAVEEVRTDLAPALLEFIWEQPQGAGAASSLEINGIAMFEFLNAVTRSITGHVRIPPDTDLTGAIALASELITSVVGGGAADVQWSADLKYTNALGIVTGSSQTLTPISSVNNVLNELQTLTMSLNPALMGAGTLIKCTLSRLGADVADTFTGRVAIVRVAQLRYER